MYQPVDLTRFAFSEFERGLEDLTDEDARVRPKKADGTHMNSISWTVGHIAWQWTHLAILAGFMRGMSDEEARDLAQLRHPVFPYRVGSQDPTPPELEEAQRWLSHAKALSEWAATAGDTLLSTPANTLSPPKSGPCRELYDAWMTERATIWSTTETLGCSLTRFTLHIWFHTGEVNAMRQMLGHPEIRFVSRDADKFAWPPRP